MLKPSWPRRGRRNEILSRPTRWHTRRVAGIGYVSRWHALYSSSTATGASTSDESFSEVYDEAVESEDGSYASDACADDLETIQEEEDAGGTLFASAAAVPTGPTALPTASVTGAPVAPAIPDGSTAIPAATTAGAADDDEDDSTSGSDPTSGPERRDREDDDGEGPEGPWQV